MNCIATALLYITICLSYKSQASEMSNLRFVMPEHVLKNEDIHGECSSDRYYPGIMITRKNGCNFKMDKHRRDESVNMTKIYSTDFVIKKVTATCEYTCFLESLKLKKTVTIEDAWILPTSSNINAFEALPVKLECTVQTNAQSKHKVVWMKGDSFITGNGYSIESTEFDSKTNTQSHYLTIHKASPGAYTCKLISANMKVIDTKTQHVITENDSTISSSLLNYLTQFFKWN